MEVARMKIGIVGYGIVGSAVGKLFQSEGIDPHIYDPPKSFLEWEPINECDAAFVCLPTPARDGKLDTGLVQEAITRIEAPLIIIKSTVNPGDTEAWVHMTGKKIVVCPEFLGETVAHPNRDMRDRSHIVLGGRRSARKMAIRVFQEVYPATITMFECDALTAELIKLAENAYLATRVTFFNSLYDICEQLDVDYDLLREGLTLDERIGKSHSFVYGDNRGWSSSKCLNKDVPALVTVARGLKVPMKFWVGLIEQNRTHNRRNK